MDRDEKKPIIKAEPVLDEQINTSNKAFEDPEVDIVSLTNKGDFTSNKNEDPDATDYSSSFADTDSDAEICSRVSDAEVESEFFGGNGLACNFDAFSSTFKMRRKKLTDHWRNFIRPLMWRCKWAELRIKETELQELKYRKELAEYDKRKHMEPDHFTLEESGSKSLPFSSDRYRSSAKKRRKRKKVEDTTEFASYTSNHYLFSYLENKKPDLDGCSADDLSNPVITDLFADSTERFRIGDDHSFFEFSDDDGRLEHILWAIDNLYSRLQKLKSEVDDVMSKNASKFSSSENLSLLPYGDAQTSSAPSPTTSAANGDTVSMGAIYNSSEHVPEFDLGDLVIPDNVSSYGDVTIIPDIIESTVGLLSAADVTLDPPLAGDLCEDMLDNILIPELAETEEHEFESAGPHPIEQLQEVEKGEVEENPHPAFVPSSDVNNIDVKPDVSQEQSTLKACLYGDINVPKNKRKRGERKAGFGGWSKKCSGEPDSQ